MPLMRGQHPRGTPLLITGLCSATPLGTTGSGGTLSPEPGLQEVLGEHVELQQPVLLTPTPVPQGPCDRHPSGGLPGTHPWVVEAVTLTTMMVALVRICCRFSLFLHLSRLLPSSWGRRG